MKDEQVENRIVTLHGMGWSIRRIAQELRISRKRIHRILISQSVLIDTTLEERLRQKRPRTSSVLHMTGVIIISSSLRISRES
jgi:hypothetical protein